jgi:hypothetical protein
MELRDGALTEEKQSSCDDHSQGLDCGCKDVVPSTTQEKGWFGKAYEKEYVHHGIQDRITSQALSFRRGTLH